MEEVFETFLSHCWMVFGIWSVCKLLDVLWMVAKMDDRIKRRLSRRTEDVQYNEDAGRVLVLRMPHPRRDGEMESQVKAGSGS